jgi:P27 family predicted phage terminase small subunit
MTIPKDLKKAGKAFWQSVMKENDLRESHDLARLEMAAKCLDDIASAEDQIKKGGLFVADRYGQMKENPAAKTIRENRIIFCRIIRELGLDLEIQESRPPRLY